MKSWKFLRVDIMLHAGRELQRLHHQSAITVTAHRQVGAHGHGVVERRYQEHWTDDFWGSAGHGSSRECRRLGTGEGVGGRERGRKGNVRFKTARGYLVSTAR